MEEHFAWMTTRRIKPGTLTGFERAWRLDIHPEGMLRAYAYWSEDEQEIAEVSFWASKDPCEAWRASDGKARRPGRRRVPARPGEPVPPGPR
jgi:heme-degrading monooxygenase HmoA